MIKLFFMTLLFYNTHCYDYSLGVGHRIDADHAGRKKT